MLLPKKDNLNILENSIRYDKELFNSLYPREVEWKEEYALSQIGPDIISLITKKLNNNMFMDLDKYIIGNHISWFNHSNNPNSYVLPTIIDTRLELYFVVFLVVSKKEIKQADEILIKYNDTINFTENELNINQSPLQLHQPALQLDQSNQHKPEYFFKLIESALSQYENTPIYHQVMMKQIYSYYGFYTVDDIINPSNRFLDLIKKQSYYNENDLCSSIEPWLQVISEKLSHKCIGYTFNKVTFVVLIASHINYDNQIVYFEKCLDSLVNQTKPIDILCSISFENENYREKFNEMISKKTIKNTKMFYRESKQSQFQHLFSLMEHIHDYDLVLFCDDDDTYHVDRAKIFEGYYDHIIGGMKNEKKIFGGIHEGVDPNKPTEYWKWAIPPNMLFSFHDRIKNYDDIISHKYCDVVFTNYIRKLNQSYEFAYFDLPYELYHYNQHDEGVLGKLQKDKKIIMSDIIKNNLFLYACYQYSLENCEKALIEKLKINKKNLRQTFPKYIQYFNRLIATFKTIYDIHL